MSSHRATSSAGSGSGEPALRAPLGGQSHYQLLELSPQASAAELRQAFRNLSKRYHPDTTTLPQDQAREAFTRLRQAYAVLADPESRRAYDAALMQPVAPLVVVPPLPVESAAAARPIGVRRSLSGGEWFALVLLGLALALSLVLGVGLAWARGAALVTRPSWWSDATVAAADKASRDSLAPDDTAPDSSALEASASGTAASGSVDLRRVAPARGGPDRGAVERLGLEPAARDGRTAASMRPPVTAMRQQAVSGSVPVLPPLSPVVPANRGGIRQAP